MSALEQLQMRLWEIAHRFTRDAGKLIEQRVEREVARVDEALAIALSAYASDEETPDVEVEKPVRDRAPARAAVSKRRRRNAAPARARADRGDRAPAVPAEVASAQSSPPAKRAPEPTAAPKKRAQMKCGKCGALGFRADGCGTSHQPLNQSATVGDRDIKPANVPDPEPPPPPSRSDRFARIEAAARARREGAGQ